MNDLEAKKQREKFFSTLSKEVIQCLHKISSKKLALNPDVLSSMLSCNDNLAIMFSKNVLELDNALTELKHWKGLYLEQKKNNSITNEDISTKESLFKKILLIIDRIVISSFDTEISEEFKAVRSAIEHNVSNEVLTECLNKLNRLVRKYKDNFPDFDTGQADIKKKDKKARDTYKAELPLEVETETKKHIYYDFTSRLRAILPNVVADIEKIEKLIVDKFSKEKTSRFVDEIITVINKENALTEQEKGELKNTIMMLLSELNETEKNVLATLDFYKEKVESDSEFHYTISGNVTDIKDSFEMTKDVNELKKMVTERAHGITSSIKKKVENDKVHTNNINSELKSLQKRVKKAHTEVKRYKEKAKSFEAEAYTDTLTNIPNRRSIDEKLKDEYERFSRYGHPCSILVCDLDKFKGINDTYGHTTGDTVLKKVAYLLKKNTRACDFVGRYGGEEFLAVLPDTHSDGGFIAAEKIRKLIDESKFYYKAEEVNVTISIGITEFLKKDDIESAFKRADDALYKAKEAGRNRVIKY